MELVSLLKYSILMILLIKQNMIQLISTVEHYLIWNSIVQLMLHNHNDFI